MWETRFVGSELARALEGACEQAAYEEVDGARKQAADATADRFS